MTARSTAFSAAALDGRLSINAPRTSFTRLRQISLSPCELANIQLRRISTATVLAS